MFKKLLPIIMFVFITACANTQVCPMSGMGMKMPCCEKCADCCKNDECKCCKNGMCKACMGKTEGMSAMKKGMQCPMMKNDTKDGKPCSCCGDMMKNGMDMKSSPEKAVKSKTTSDADHKAHHPQQ